MATTVLPTPHDVQTTLNYFKFVGDEPPYTYVSAPPEGTPKSNVGTEPHAAVIHDVRGKEDTVSLDTTGFQFVKHISAEKEFVDEDVIKAGYYAEVEGLLKKETGAKRVFIFDHIVRRATFDTFGGARGPSERVHVDQTFDAGFERVHLHLGADAEQLLKSRVRIINVWRPIANPVAHHPLAVADWRTLNVVHDLVPVRLIYPDRVSGSFGVKHNPQLEWYFLSDQTPDEVILIKCFDSETDTARLTPHTAFRDNTSPEDAPHRQSIEVRALVFDSE